MEFRLDNTKLLLWPKWITSILPQTKVREVKGYSGWEVRNFPGGPVWVEYNITNEEMQFMAPLGERMTDDEEIGKYGQVVKVKTEPRQWRQPLCQPRFTREAKDTMDKEENHVNAPSYAQSWI